MPGGRSRCASWPRLRSETSRTQRTAPPEAFEGCAGGCAGVQVADGPSGAEVSIPGSGNGSQELGNSRLATRGRAAEVRSQVGMGGKLSTAKRARAPQKVRGPVDPDKGAADWIFSTWPDRVGAARRLGLTRSQFRTLERAGTFRYRDCEWSGRRVFDPMQLAEYKLRIPTKTTKPKTHALKKAIAGDASAKAFRMFDDQAALRDIVKACDLNPDQVYELREHYIQMGSDCVLSSNAVKDLRQVLPTWNGKTEDGLTSAITRRIREAYENGKASNANSSGQSAQGSGAPPEGAGNVAGDHVGQADAEDRKGARKSGGVRRAVGHGSGVVSAPDGGTRKSAGASSVADDGKGIASGTELNPGELEELGSRAAS